MARYPKLLDTQDVYIKLFKDIPKADLDMLLPGTQVKMSLVDRAKILLPTLSGLSIAIWKIVQGALIAAAAGFYGVAGLLGSGRRHARLRSALVLRLSEHEAKVPAQPDAKPVLSKPRQQRRRDLPLARRSRGAGKPRGDAGLLLSVATRAGRRLDRRRSSTSGSRRCCASRADQEVDFEVGDALAKLERLATRRIDAPAGAGRRCRSTRPSNSLELHRWRMPALSADESRLYANWP